MHTESRPVDDINAPAVVQVRNDLHAVLSAFRAKHGFGRAVSAPQLGVNLRLIAFNMNGKAFTMHNPRLLHAPGMISAKAPPITLWDDCLSAPDYLVRVRRASVLSVEYYDEDGNKQLLRDVDKDFAELLQHEMDHLDGLSLFDRMVPGDGAPRVVHRDLYRGEYKKQLDSLVSLSYPEINLN